MKRYLLCIALIACVALLPVAARAQTQGDISFKILKSFAINHSPGTYAQAISNNDMISGFYVQDGLLTGFIQPRNGHTTKGIVFVPGAQTYLPGINSSGLAVGYKQDVNGLAGFLYQDGTITPYNVPIVAADYTVLNGVNDAGDFTGYYLYSSSYYVAFASLDGRIVNFGVPGAFITVPQAINNQHEIVGWYAENNGTMHGFIRQPNRQLIYPIDFPGANWTVLSGVNDQGVIVGSFNVTNEYGHGLVMQSHGEMTQVDIYPDRSTSIQGINNELRICGYTASIQTGDTSFIAQLLP